MQCGKGVDLGKWHRAKVYILIISLLLLVLCKLFVLL